MRLTSFAVLSLAAVALAGCENNQSPIWVDPLSLELRNNTSTAVTEGELPRTVTEEFRKLYPEGQITRIEQRQYFMGDKYYRVHFVPNRNEPGAVKIHDFNASLARS